MMVQRFRLRLAQRRIAAPLIAAAVALTAGILAPPVSAQTSPNYTCFPTCSTTDGRFLSLAGTGLNAFAGDEIVIGIGVPSGTTSFEIGIFDGETGGMWDEGTAPLRYTLYPDPDGDGTATTEIDHWDGTEMTNNAWYSIPLDVHAAALAANGNYVYYLHVEAVDNTTIGTSSFKVRTTGTITIKSHQSFSIMAPMSQSSELSVISPNYPDQSTTTYNGEWRLYLDVPSASSKLVVWDGDMDRGDQWGDSLDTDDQNTSNTSPPTWATSDARAEGVATSASAVWLDNSGSSRSATETTTADPADDNGSALYRRSPGIRYLVYAPNGTAYYVNDNPSGNLEWEQFVIHTESDDRSVSDVLASSLPGGIYRVQLIGMDMRNVNSWRFFNDVSGVPVDNVQVLGVDADGDPVVPLRAFDAVNGSVSGVVYYDTDGDGTQDAGELGIPSVTVTMTQYDANGISVSTVQVVTDADGEYTFSPFVAASYRVTADVNTLQEDVVTTGDGDGVTTANYAGFTLSATAASHTLSFGYERVVPTQAPETHTRGYWVNHEEVWPEFPTAGLQIGDRFYSNSDADVEGESLMDILRKPTRGDRTYSMAAQLIAAKLNLLNGCTDCISTAIAKADVWLDEFPVGDGCSSAQWSSQWTSDDGTVTIVADDIHDELDDYNNNGCPADMN